MLNVSKLQKRLIMKVRQIESGTPVIPTPCWHWRAACDNRGRPIVWHQGNASSALRVSYIAFRESVPKNKIVTNICLNPKCINPLHLIASTLHSAHFLRGRCPDWFKWDHRKILVELLHTKAPIEVMEIATGLPAPDISALVQGFHQQRLTS